jgi:hypothetical protein
MIMIATNIITTAITKNPTPKAIHVDTRCKDAVSTNYSRILPALYMEE